MPFLKVEAAPAVSPAKVGKKGKSLFLGLTAEVLCGYIPLI